VWLQIPFGLCISNSLVVQCISSSQRKAFHVDFVWSVHLALICMFQLYIHIYLYMLHSFSHCLIALDAVYSILNHTTICVGSCNMSTYYICITASFITFNLFNKYSLCLLTTACVLVISLSEPYFYICVLREIGPQLGCMYGSILVHHINSEFTGVI
jgi:hypothetical protein